MDQNSCVNELKLQYTFLVEKFKIKNQRDCLSNFINRIRSKLRPTYLHSTLFPKTHSQRAKDFSCIAKLAKIIARMQCVSRANNMIDYLQLGQYNNNCILSRQPMRQLFIGLTKVQLPRKHKSRTMQMMRPAHI